MENREDQINRIFNEYKRVLHLRVSIVDDKDPLTIHLDGVVKKLFSDGLVIGFNLSEKSARTQLSKSVSTFQKKVNKLAKEANEYRLSSEYRKEGQRKMQKYIDEVLKPDSDKAIGLLKELMDKLHACAFPPPHQRLSYQDSADILTKIDKFLKEREEKDSPEVLKITKFWEDVEKEWEEELIDWTTSEEISKSAAAIIMDETFRKVFQIPKLPPGTYNEYLRLKGIFGSGSLIKDDEEERSLLEAMKKLGISPLDWRE